MSEEEAIEWAKALLQDKEKYAKYHSWVGTNTFASIQILLNLIDKKQEELETEKQYTKIYEDIVKGYEKICIEKNKKIEELEEEIDQMNKDKWEGWLEENE